MSGKRKKKRMQEFVNHGDSIQDGLIVYGVGAHLADMLFWHPDLMGRISRIFDKDETKQGKKAPGTDILVEGLDELKHLPTGTKIAVSAIRYYQEIAEELSALNPGLICQDIDDVYRKLVTFSLSIPEKEVSNEQRMRDYKYVENVYDISILHQKKYVGILTTQQCLYVAELLKDNLHMEDFGCEICTDVEQIDFESEDLYIVICPQMFRCLPKNYIAFQLEQSISSRWFNDEYIARLKRSIAIFDFSLTNIEYLQTQGIPSGKIFYMPISPTDRAEKIENHNYEYDVLFYGDVHSDRREKFLNKIQEKFDVKIISNLFGEELKKELEKARIVLNIHFYEGAVLETTRLSEVLSIGRSLIISERSSEEDLDNQFKNCVDFIEIDDIDMMIEKVGFWLSDFNLLERKVQSANANRKNVFPFFFKRFLMTVGLITFEDFCNKTADCFNFDFINENAAKCGMIVYGAGAHLADMMSWYPELKGVICRIFDNDETKQGKKALGTDILVEGLDGLKHLPTGTKIAVAAIRYYREIVEELSVLNPGLICQNIDDVYRRLSPFLTQETASAHHNAKDIAIGNVVLNFDTYSPDKDIYSDGDIENEILQIVKDNREEEVLREDNRWPILYHFSKTRQNILSWYSFKDNARLLEIGTGCGATTGLFCARNLQVTGVESSKRRATITAYRNKEYENLQLYVGNFIDMKFENKFDYITLIGVLEYSNMFLPEGHNSFTEMLEHCRCLLEDDGKIFIAIENRLGMKYFAGAAEDHTGRRFEGIENYPEGNGVRTFSRSELQNLIRDAGFSQVEWFYPYPDYKLPRQIFSDEFLPTAELLTVVVEAYDNARVQLFDEMQAIKSLAGTEEFKIFSNSYLLIVSK